MFNLVKRRDKEVGEFNIYKDIAERPREIFILG